jgi:hypothetical protein
MLVAKIYERAIKVFLEGAYLKYCHEEIFHPVV